MSNLYLSIVDDPAHHTICEGVYMSHLYLSIVDDPTHHTIYTGVYMSLLYLSIVDDPAHHLEELVAILVRCRLVNQEKLMEPKQRD